MQIPYILNKEFSNNVQYSEYSLPSLDDFLICFWEMRPKTADSSTVKNIIIADACIDLVVDFDNKQIGFVGMSKTNFDYELNTKSRFFGARMKPGAFYALTKIPAITAMDGFIAVDAFDGSFDKERFFKLSYDKAKSALTDYLLKLANGKSPDTYVAFFENLYESMPANTKEIYNRLNFSAKQCQRLFLKHYGLTPKMTLCILRFQKCIGILTSDNLNRGDYISGYYDQSHFINDFKRYIGITPSELLEKYE